MVRTNLRSVGDAEEFHRALDRAQRGDPAALEALTRRYYPTVQALVHHRLASDMRRSRPWLTSRFSTGDIVQEVFQGVLRDVGAFAGETEEAFVGFLATMVRNRIIDAVRFHEASQRDGRRGQGMQPGFDAEGSERDPAEAVASAEELERFFEALAAFSPREQHLLRARLDGVATFKELAAQLGYGSESAARRAFFDVQAKLALRLRTA